MPELQLDREDLARLVISLAQGELTRMRPGQPVPPTSQWDVMTNLLSPKMGLDSHERLQLVSAVIEMFHLYETRAEDRLLLSGEICFWLDSIEDSLAQYAKRFSFLKAGTGGRTRLCIHEWTTLDQELSEWAGILAGHNRIVSFVPCHNVYGFLFTILLPKALGIPVLDTHFEGEPAWMEGDLIISSPDHLKSFAATSEVLPRRSSVVSSMGTLRPKEAAALRSKGIGSVIEIFGSPEAGSIGYRYHSAEPFELLPYFDVTGEQDLIRRLPEDRLRHMELPAAVKWLNPRAFHLMEHKDKATTEGSIGNYPLEILTMDREELLLAQSAVSAS